jgi:hypothetical protein
MAAFPNSLAPGLTPSLATNADVSGQYSGIATFSSYVDGPPRFGSGKLRPRVQIFGGLSFT